jgi:aspartate/methionine/tyrosine aminotransferase
MWNSVMLMPLPFDQRRRAIVPMLNALPGFECVEPAGAFYAFPRIAGTGRTGKDLQTDILEKAGVATVAGTSFGVKADAFIRFSYANSLENIETAIERIGALLAE